MSTRRSMVWIVIPGLRALSPPVVRGSRCFPGSWRGRGLRVMGICRISIWGLWLGVARALKRISVWGWRYHR
ncbi:hypothetical protein HOY80DRAFT_994533, partial [Tuber brumale]